MKRLSAFPLTQAIVGGLSLALALSVGTQAWAQGRQTGTLRGSAHDSSDAVLPGVAVTVASPSMQGTRSAVTDMNGNYALIGLANGVYLATFRLDGFTTLETTVTVPLGGMVETHVSMRVGRVAETVQVTAVVPSPLASTGASANVTGEQVGTLPVGRSPFRIAELTPGLTANTPNNGQLAINGSFAYDNVFLIDGVDVNDNIFGDADNLFIEDAIEEVQVLTSGISAEYGRFSGGVVNVVTKSGGNQFAEPGRASGEGGQRRHWKYQLGGPQHAGAAPRRDLRCEGRRTIHVFVHLQSVRRQVQRVAVWPEHQCRHPRSPARRVHRAAGAGSRLRAWIRPEQLLHRRGGTFQSATSSSMTT